MRAVGFTEQPRLTLQRADERRQIAIDERAHDLFHDNGLVLEAAGDQNASLTAARSLLHPERRERRRDRRASHGT